MELNCPRERFCRERGLVFLKGDIMEFHKLQEADRDTFLEMAREFYHSDAVLKPVPDSYFENTLKECLRSDEYLLCYILEWGESAAGYALLSKSYSPEAGGPVLWVEEIYIRPAFRAHRIGSAQNCS